MPLLPLLRVLFGLLSALLLVIAAHLLGLWHHGLAFEMRGIHQRDWLIYAGIGVTGWALLGQAIASRSITQPQRK